MKYLKFLDVFPGFKTYVAGAALVAYGVGGFLSGNLTIEVAGPLVVTGLGLITGRVATARK